MKEETGKIMEIKSPRWKHTWEVFDLVDDVVEFVLDLTTLEEDIIWREEFHGTLVSNLEYLLSQVKVIGKLKPVERIEFHVHPHFKGWNLGPEYPITFIYGINDISWHYHYDNGSKVKIKFHFSKEKNK